MKIQFLADYPAAIPLLANWYYQEWGHEVPGNTPEKEAEKLKAYLHTDPLPLLLLAMEEQTVLGAAQLKYREMERYPEKEHWLGGVYVAPAHRGQGIAATLIQRLVSFAKEQNVRTLYLQTEHLDGGLYLRLGWTPIETVNNHGVEVLVMERELGH